MYSRHFIKAQRIELYFGLSTTDLKTFQKYGLHDCSIAWTRSRGESWLWLHLMGNAVSPAHGYSVALVNTPSCKPINAIIGLNEEPGGYMASKARLKSGLRVSSYSKL